MEQDSIEEKKIIIHKSDWGNQAIKVVIVLALLFFVVYKNPKKSDFIAKIIESELSTGESATNSISKGISVIGAEALSTFIAPFIDRTDFLLFSRYSVEYPIDSVKRKIIGYGFWDKIFIVKDDKVVKITNSGGNNIHVAYAYYNGGDWTSTGWWEFKPHTSGSIKINDYEYDKIYLRVQSSNGTWWGNQRYFCSDANAFEFPRQDKCSDTRGYYILTLKSDTTYQNFDSGIASDQPKRRAGGGVEVPAGGGTTTPEQFVNQDDAKKHLARKKQKEEEMKPRIDAVINNIVRDSHTRKDIANVYWTRKYTLFDYITDEPIIPAVNNGSKLYKIFYSSNEDPNPHYGEFTEGELEELFCYKFKNKENCNKFCNTK